MNDILNDNNFRKSGKKKLLLAFLFLFSISVIMGSLGLDWGQPSTYSWHPDSIVGQETIESMPYLFDGWGNNIKYPKAHFLVVALVYKPLVKYWESDPKKLTDSGGKITLKVVDEQRMSVLIMASRLISLLMGAGTVLVIFMTAGVLFNDFRAAVFSALAMAFMQNFVFHMHLGSLDVPATFWFVLSVYNGICAVRYDNWRYYILFGLFSGLAVCTKDHLGGYLVGLFVAMWLYKSAISSIESNVPFKRGTIIFLNRKTFLALLVSLLVFSFLNDLFTQPMSFVNRMRFWVGGPGVVNFNQGFAGHGNLLLRTFNEICYSMGWPMFLAIILSLVYCIYRYRWKSVFGFMPIVFFYLVIIINIKFSIARFFIPGFACLVLLVGKCFADLSRSKKTPKILLAFPVLFVYLSSFLYCLGLDLEMIDDPRYRAEEWLSKNVNKSSLVAGMAPEWYLPRLSYAKSGHFYFRDRPKNEAKLKSIINDVDYLVLSEIELNNPKAFSREFSAKLLSGKAGYRKVASFKNKFLYPQKTIFSFPGWPLERNHFVGPEITIMKRVDF